ncbi:MAG: protein kinase [Acidobacteriota bacterium]
MMNSSEDANPAMTAAAMVPADGAKMGAVVGQPYAERTTFAAGDVLEKRFKILRFIAQGGAGEVYEAHDLELRCPVALKVVRREVAENERAIERFRREIALARQVTHPNVCRIFDVFRHELPPEHPGEEPVQSLFLTMELLVGESLAAHIHRHGPMSEEDCLPLVEDMVSGLTAAHRAGVIHRDFKSANVMLARDATGLRAVVTDFGLARAQDPDDPAPLTHTGTVVGTPNYMAPEQLTGEEVGPAVDTYALGIVMYEMVTGKRPFRGDTDLSTAVKRLTEKPASPKLLTPSLSPDWEGAILRCLERDAEDRFTNLDDLVEVLSGRTEIAPLEEPKPSRGASFWVAAASIGAFVLLSTLLLLSGLQRGDAFASDLGPALAENRKPRIAILALRNLARDADTEWLSSALAEMVAVELELPGDLETLRAEDVRAAASELTLDLETELGRESVALLRRQLGADIVLEGSYLARTDDELLRLNLRLHTDTEPRLVTIEGLQSDLVDVVDDASTDIRRDLGLRGEGEETVSETERLFQVGRTALENGDLLTAREILEQVVDKTPEDARAQTDLAWAHQLLGDPAPARTSAILATRVSGGANREIQLRSQGYLALIEGEVAEAAELFVALHRFYPDTAEYAELLAETLRRAEAPDRAVEVLDRVIARNLRPIETVRLALMRADVLSGLEGGTDAARQAVEAAEAAGAGTLAAHARVLVARDQLRRGEVAAARESLLLAEARFRQDRLGLPLAEVLDLRARVEAQVGGDPTTIRRLEEEAAALRA